MEEYLEHAGRLLTWIFLFLLAVPVLLWGQATEPPNMGGSPITPQPSNAGWQGNMATQPSQQQTWNYSTGRFETTYNPNPYSSPTPEATRWFVENNFKSLDPIYRENIINGAIPGFLTSSPYLPPSPSNPGGMNSNPLYQTGMGARPNWFLPSTWSSPTMNWQGVQPNGFLPQRNGFLPTTATRVYSPSVSTTSYQTSYNPVNFTNNTRFSIPAPSQSPTTSYQYTGLSPSLLRTPQSSLGPTNIAKMLGDVQRTLSLHETAGDKVAQVVDHAELARIFVDADEPQKALSEIGTAESLAKPLSDPKLNLQLLQIRTAANIASGKFEEAIETNKGIMIRFRSLHDEHGQAETYVSSGWAFESLGEAQSALGCYEAALYLFSKLGDKEARSRVLIAAGSLYQSMGEFTKAAEKYRQAFPSASSEQQARIDASLAEMHLAQGNTFLALQLFQKAVRLVSEPRTLEEHPTLKRGVWRHVAFDGPTWRGWTASEDFTLQGSLLAGIGRCHMALHSYAEAQNDFDQARAKMIIGGNIAAQAGVMASIGELSYWVAISTPWLSGKEGDPKKHFKTALQQYNEALPMMTATGDRAGEIGILTNIGLVFDAQGKYREALDYYLRALAKMEDLQTSARLEEFRIDIADQANQLYQRAILLEAHLNRMEEAFNLSERARARLFLDQLGNRRINNSLPHEFVEHETKLREQSTFLERRLGQELAKPGPEFDSAKMLALESQLSELRKQYAEDVRELKLQNPEFATFLTISPLTLREAQSQIPVDETVVSYFTTPSVTLAFVISRNSFHVSRIRVDAAQLGMAIATFFDFASDRDASPSLKTLHNWLIAPIKSELKTSRVAIVPYGVLHDVPFAALSRDGKSYLGDEHTIFMLPSVSVLPFISPRSKPTGQRLLVFANDQSEGLPRLRHAYEEATEIASLYNTRAVLGDAAEASLFTKSAGDYELVHLIAHIEHDKQNPELVRIVLGRDHGNSESLDTAQLLGLELLQTDLVVLSGCQSEVGRRTRGDDILGLSRALIYAGSRSVIASLWSVDDAATRLLMVAFYRHLREGLSKADSLRAAQMEVRQKYPHPYYWAGFVLTGDPGPSETSSVLANVHR